jgi:mannosyltransferase
VTGAGAGYDGDMAGAGPAHREGTRRKPRQRLIATWAALLGPGIALLLVDGYDLGRVPLWRDEAYTVDAAHRSLAQIFTLLAHADAVNNAYYVLMHADIVLLGTSPTALRVPSLLAMAAAAVMTAAIGHRLAGPARLPAPALTGLLAGLLFVAAPQVTRYAQEARSYGLVTMCATIASYLLLRAVADGRRRWWAGYGLAIALAGLFNLLALLLVIPHAVTLGIARSRQPAAQRTVRLSHWLAAVAAAAVVLSPLLVLGYLQRGQISWLTRPGVSAVSHLVVAFAGSRSLVALSALLVMVAVAGCLAMRPRPPVDAATLALPWLVLPAVILLAVSQIHPMYDTRYILYSLPALALLMASGLAWLTRLARQAVPASAGRAAGALSWLPAVAVLALLAAMVLAPQRLIRLPSARADNLATISAIVAANEQPGDGVLYLPSNRRVFGMAYPAPFRRLRDLSQAKSPVAAANLLGTEVPAPALLARGARVNRIWLVSDRDGLVTLQNPRGPQQKAEAVLLRSFHLVRRWMVRADMLSLFVRR